MNWIEPKLRTNYGVALSVLIKQAAACASLLWMAAAAAADEAKWKELVAATGAAVQAGKLDEAEQSGQQAAAEAIATFAAQDARIGESWSSLGMVQYRSAKFEQAAATFQKAIDVYTGSLPPGDLRSQNAKYNLGQAKFKLQKFDESFAAIASALQEAESRVGQDNPGLVPLLHELAGQAIAAKKPEDALTHAARALQIEVAARGANSSEAAAAHEYQGNVFAALKRPAEAVAPFEQALAIREQFSRRCDTEVIRTLDNLHRAQGQAGQLEMALARLDDALARAATALGAQSPGLRPLLRSKAALLTQLNRSADSQMVAEQLQKLDEIAKWQEQLVAAKRLRGQNKLDEATAALGAVATAGQSFGEAGLVATQLATEQGELAFAKKELEAAEKYFARALELNEQLFGKEHVTVASAQTNLGILRGQLGQPAEGIRCYEQGLAAYRAAPSTDKEVFHNLLLLLGMAYFNSQRHAEAEPLLLNLVELRKEIHPTEEQRTAEFWNYLGVACQAQGKLVDAQSCFRVADTLLARHLPAEHALRKQVASNAAHVEQQLKTAAPASASQPASPVAESAPQVASAPQPAASPPEPSTAITGQKAAPVDPASLITGGGVGLLLGLFVAITAGRRGFNSLVWFVTFCIFGNPIILLAVLTILPNRKLEKLRQTEQRRLAELLAQPKTAAPQQSVPAQVAIAESLGDQKTSLTNG